MVVLNSVAKNLREILSLDIRVHDWPSSAVDSKPLLQYGPRDAHILCLATYALS